MVNFTIAEVIDWTGGDAEFYGKYAGGKNLSDTLSDVSTDSRKISQDALFFSLPGAKFDGDNFVCDVISRGVRCAVVSKNFTGAISGDAVIVKVSDRLSALGVLANRYENAYFKDVIRVGITGSVGKTTTKDIVAHVLSVKYNTHRTHMNFNNEIGLPMTILSMEEGTEALVTEMGMSGLGQIKYLVDIARPKFGVITNVGSAHLEMLGSRDNILRAKMEIVSESDGFVLVVNNDNDLLSNTENLYKIASEYGATNLKIITVGIKNSADYTAKNVRIGETDVSYMFVAPFGEFDVNIPVPGEHNIYNTMSALALAHELGIDPNEAASSISNFGNDSGRQKIVRLPGITLIDDTYNASPEAMEASLKVLAGLRADTHIAVFGDMLELGAETKNAHNKVGALTQKYADLLMAGGANARFYAETAGPNARSYGDTESLCKAVLQEIDEVQSTGKTVALLIKGSHSTHMDFVSREIVSKYERTNH